MYTIKEVSKLMNISEHTLRFWAKNGFIPDIIRDKNNTRLFTDKSMEWLKIIICLRNCGTDLKSVKRYIDLTLIGDSTIQERYEIIRMTKQKALEQLNNIQIQIELLKYKENKYKSLIESSTQKKNKNKSHL